MHNVSMFSKDPEDKAPISNSIKYKKDDRQQVSSDLLQEASFDSLSINLLPMSTYSNLTLQDADNQLVSAPSSLNNVRTTFFEFHGQRVVGFHTEGKHMVCLPQIYELFLKQHVGGLHTVYTKLKRLNIHPVICNVDQVRALRSLGAIQPGVNRCKLIDRNDFDKLYHGCVQSTSRPGRPPKKFMYLDELQLNQNLLPTSTNQPSQFLQSPSAFGGNTNDCTSTPANISQFLAFNPHQIIVQQIIAAAASLASQPSIDGSNSFSDRKMEDLTKQTETTEMENDKWGQDKNEKETPSPNQNSVSSNENSSAPSLPSNSLTAGSDRYSFDREKSSSLMNNSERGYSSGSSDNCMQNSDMQTMFTKFTTTVDEMEKRFTEHYDKLTAVATKMQNLEEHLFLNLASYKERSQLYYRRYVNAKYQTAHLKKKILSRNKT